jgi:threonine dehydratase
MNRAPSLPDDPTPHHRLQFPHFLAARKVIDPVFLNSPQYDCEPLSAALGCNLILKIETANPIRCFKGRGASYLIQSMSADDRPVVGASAGNWGQALAYSCRTHGRRLILFASVNANPLKVDRMRALGADVRLVGDDFDAAKIEAESFAAENGFRMVADGLDPEASYGAGTMAMELLDNKTTFNAILIPCGNGAMLTGMGRWIKAASPSTKVIGVQSTGADAMEKSWRTRQIIIQQSVNTIADGIGVRVPIAEAVEDMKDTVDDVMLVADSDIARAMKLAFETSGHILEPSGAAGIAAILANPDAFRQKSIATVLCGGNATQDQIRRYMLA